MSSLGAYKRLESFAWIPKGGKAAVSMASTKNMFAAGQNKRVYVARLDSLLGVL